MIDLTGSHGDGWQCTLAHTQPDLSPTWHSLQTWINSKTQKIHGWVTRVRGEEYLAIVADPGFLFEGAL